jgi:hypothetical protein
MLPFSYQGFGFTAILLMVLTVAAGQAFRYVKDHYFNHDQTHDQ